MLKATSIDKSLFRAYDIRGVVDEALTEENVYLIGKGIGSIVQERGEQQLTVARDGRLSGERLTIALTEGVLATGCDVIDIGMVPTPLLYYATRVFDQHSGVMVTGSHNPPEYNGFKIVIAGAMLAEEGIQNLYQRIHAEQFKSGKGNQYVRDVIERYISVLKHNIHLERPISIILDAGNGVTGMIAPRLFRELGCEVTELCCEVNGNFPNHHPDPTQAENLQMLDAALRKNKNAEVGLAFDGDGDRLGLMTELGEIVNADRILMLFAQDLLSKRPGAKIIYDVKCSNQLAKLIAMLGGEPIMWKTGHSLIKAKLQETNALLAGEMSGHIFFKDRWFGFDDALYAGARFLELLSQQDKKSSHLFASIPNSINTPELKVMVTEDEKFALVESVIKKANFKEAKTVNTIDGLRVDFDDGFGLIRASNTSPCLVLRFEAINQVILQQIQQLFRELILSVKPDLALPF